VDLLRLDAQLRAWTSSENKVMYLLDVLHPQVKWFSMLLAKPGSVEGRRE
jgi:hypothetical protein